MFTVSHFSELAQTLCRLELTNGKGDDVWFEQPFWTQMLIANRTAALRKIYISSNRMDTEKGANKIELKRLNILKRSYFIIN